MCEYVKLTVSRVNSFGASSMFGVVVHEHVIGNGEEIAVDAHFSQYDDLQ